MKKSLLFLVMAIALVCFATGCNDSNNKSNVIVNVDDNSNVTIDNENVPLASEIRQCTLCDDGQSLFEDNIWLGEKYGDKIFYIVLRSEKITDARKVYVAGINDENELVIHNQRNIADELTPDRLANIFGANFYEFGPEEIVNPKDSVEIEMVGLMKEVSFLKDLINPSEVVSNEKCGKSYPVDEDNWESKFPVGALFYTFDQVKGKVKFNKKENQVLTFDCQRELSAKKQIETQSLLPLGPRIVTTDGTIAGEVINSNPPMRTTIVVNPVDQAVDVEPEPPVTLPKPVLTLQDCQNNTYIVDPDNSNSYNFQDDLDLFAEVNVVNGDEYKLKVNLKVSDDTVVTIRCWKLVAKGYDVASGELDLNILDIGFDFSDQYHPQNGGDIDTVWVGVIDSSCYSSYTVNYENWQLNIKELTVFAEVNRLHIDGLHKIKLNIRYGNIVYTFDCLRDVKESRPWSTAVFADHVTGYTFKFQGIPADAYRSEDTTWVASENKP